MVDAGLKYAKNGITSYVLKNGPKTAAFRKVYPLIGLTQTKTTAQIIVDGLLQSNRRTIGGIHVI